MKEERSVTFAIVDYGLGNLFSIKHACEHTGIRTMITSSSSEIRGADALILPGVGAFGDAVASFETIEADRCPMRVCRVGKNTVRDLSRDAVVDDREP